MTDQELKDIVSAVVAELEKSGVDFDYKAEQAKDDDLVFVIRGTAPNYQGVTVTWKGLLDIITAQATQAKNDAETAKNAANTILEQVQSKGTEITNFVATSKTEIETQKNESVEEVRTVYQSDLNELKGDLVSIKEKAILSSNDFYLSVESAINKNYEYSFKVGHNYTFKNTSESSVFVVYTVESDGVTEKEFVANGLAAGSENFFSPTQNADIIRIVSNGAGSCEIIDNDSIEHDVKRIGNNLDKVIKCSEINDRSIYNNITSLLNKQDVTFRNYPIFKQGDITKGDFVYNDKRCATDFIKNSDFINWTLKNDSSKLKFNIIAYNSDKQLVTESGLVSLSSFMISTNTDFNTAYIRLVISKIDQTQTITPDECDIWLEKIVPYNSDPSNDVIHVRPNTDISQILQGVKYAYSIGAKKVVVEAGTYDILQEYKSIYGNDYFDNYNGYITSDKFDRGIWLENIEIVFSQGALVTADYTGNNNAVKVNFSPFSCGNNVIIDGLTLYARELRYGIHPDFNSGDDVSYMIIKNCDIDFYRTLSEGKWLQCIGAGLGKHVKWEISNCIFRTPSTDAWGDCVRIHNNSDADAQSEIIIHNCYIYGIGRFGIYNFGSSTKMSKCLISGCSWETNPLIANEAGYTGEPNIETVLFCNEKRSS